MQYSEALRRRAIEIAGRRAANRIIAADELPGFTPFRLDEFGGTAAEEVPPFSDGPADDQATTAGHETPAAGRNTGPAAYRAAFDAGYKAGHHAGQQAGREAGFAEGMQRGIEQGAEQAAAEQLDALTLAGASLANRIDSLSDALSARFAELEAEAADELVALAVELAQQALRSSLAVRSEAIADVAREALAALLDERSRVRVHLNPVDAELVRTALGEQTEADRPRCEIVCDPAITPGGCRLETPRAEIDALVETRWRRTLAALGRNEDGSLGA